MNTPPTGQRAGCPGHRHTGFTLLEMIVAMAVISFALVVVVQAMARVQDTWVTTSAKVREANDARAGMETLSRVIPRAVLNPYWATDKPDDPSVLLRYSDLHFVAGPAADLLSSATRMTGHAIFFQAPNGHAGSDDRNTPESEKAHYDTLPNVLNAWGYFVEFGEDPAALPAFLASTQPGGPPRSKRWRFRLLEFRQPAHELELFQMDTTGERPVAKLSQFTDQRGLYKWFDEPLLESPGSSKRRCAVIAENILALIIQPQRPVGPSGASAVGSVDAEPLKEYLFDSRRYQWEPRTDESVRSAHRLPPAMQLTLIVVDERDWSKLTDSEALQAGTGLIGEMNSRFSAPEDFTSDMGSLTGELNRRRMRHRVITTTLQIPAGMGTPGGPAAP